MSNFERQIGETVYRTADLINKALPMGIIAGLVTGLTEIEMGQPVIGTILTGGSLLVGMIFHDDESNPPLLKNPNPSLSQLMPCLDNRGEV